MSKKTWISEFEKRQPWWQKTAMTLAVAVIYLVSKSAREDFRQVSNAL